MLEKMYELFGWPFYQQHAFENFLMMCKNFFADGLAPKRLLASLIAIVELFCSAIFKTPQPAVGPELDLTGYEQVIFDDFDGDSLDRTKWTEHHGGGLRKGGYWSDELVSVKDGCLHISTAYLENGKHYRKYHKLLL